MDVVKALTMDGKSSPGGVHPVIAAYKERLEESQESLDGATARGPTTVLEACEEERRLIALVRRHPALYDSRHPRFHDDAHKEQLWQRIASWMNIELTQCLVTWSELRYRYQRHVRRLRAFHRSAVQRRGPPVRRRPCLRHEEELLFLYPHVARFPLTTPEADAPAEGEVEGQAVVDVEIVEPAPVDIIDVDLVDDGPAFRCTNEQRRLIEAVSAYPQLYDPLHPQFANFRHRGLIWGSISNELRDKATKLIKSWLKLQTRYEWEVTHSAVYCSESELCQLMTFLRSHVLRMRGSVCKSSKYLSTGWHEPIENFRSVFALINTMRTMPEQVQMVDECTTFRAKPPRYDELWLRVGKMVGLGPERCEVTWLVLRSFHNELMAMRQAGYQLQDKWYFENALNGIVRLAASRTSKRTNNNNNNKRPYNGDGSSSEPPAKIKITPAPEPVRLPMAIVYPPAMKNNSNNISGTSGSGVIQPIQPIPNARSSIGGIAGASVIPASTSISTSDDPELPLQSFVIPTISGPVRVSATMPRPAVNLPSPIKMLPKAVPPPPPLRTIQPPPTNAVRTIPQRPGLQITVRNKMRMPTAGQMHPVIPSAMIRAVAPAPNQHLAAVPGVAVQRLNPPTSALGALLGENPQMSQISPQSLQPPPIPPATLPQMPKLIPRMPLNVVAASKSCDPAAPMVRIHQPGLHNEWDGKGTTVVPLPVLTPSTALAARAGAATTDHPVTNRVIANAATGSGAGVVAGAAAAAVALSVYPERTANVTAPLGPRAAQAAAPKIVRVTATALPTAVPAGGSTSRNGVAVEATPEKPVVGPAAPPAAPPAALSAVPAAASPTAPLAAPPAAPPTAPLAAPPAAPPATPPAAPPATPPAAPPAAPPATPPADTAASTSQGIPTDFGCSPLGIFMNAINVNLMHSPSAGNSLHIWGGGLHCNYHLNMVRTATLIREVMAVPQLHSKDPQLKAKCDGFWQIISQKFHLPEIALRACWNFLANNMSVFPLIAPMSELMRPFKGSMKVWEKSNRLFSKFDEIARKYDWMKHRDVMPEVIRHFRQHEHLYWEMRKPRPGEPAQTPRLYTDRERLEVWREAKIKFPKLNHHDIWSMFKFAFRTYMEDLERGTDNPWPQNWWQALEQLKFLVDVRYHPLEPYYYIIHNKIIEEVKRCSMYETLTCADDTDKSKTSLLARISKDPMPWCSEEAKRLLTGQLSNVNNHNAKQAPEAVPVPDIEASEAATNNTGESLLEPQAVPQPSKQKRNVVRRPAYTLPTIEAFELTRTLRRYPHTFLRAHTIHKRTAWVRVSKELKITVTECRLGLQYALREMRFLKISDPTNACTMGHKYYRHMDDIFKQVKTKSQLTVRTPQQMNQSITEPPEEVEPHKFVPDINMSTCKPGLVLKNWAYAVGTLSGESQENLTVKLTQLFAKYAKCAKTGNVSLGTTNS